MRPEGCGHKAQDTSEVHFLHLCKSKSKVEPSYAWYGPLDHNIRWKLYCSESNHAFVCNVWPFPWYWCDIAGHTIRTSLFVIRVSCACRCSVPRRSARSVLCSGPGCFLLTHAMQLETMQNHAKVYMWVRFLFGSSMRVSLLGNCGEQVMCCQYSCPNGYAILAQVPRPKWLCVKNPPSTPFLTIAAVPDVVDAPPEAIPEQYKTFVGLLHQQVLTIFQAKEIPTSSWPRAEDGYRSVEDLADRWPTITEARTNSARDLHSAHWPGRSPLDPRSVQPPGNEDVWPPADLAFMDLGGTTPNPRAGGSRVRRPPQEAVQTVCTRGDWTQIHHLGFARARWTPNQDNQEGQGWWMGEGGRRDAQIAYYQATAWAYAPQLAQAQCHPPWRRRLVSMVLGP